MDIVVNQLKQKPHNIPQYEGGDQIPMDDVSKTSYAPTQQAEWERCFNYDVSIATVKHFQS